MLARPSRLLWVVSERAHARIVWIPVGHASCSELPAASACVQLGPRPAGGRESRRSNPTRAMWQVGNSANESVWCMVRVMDDQARGHSCSVSLSDGKKKSPAEFAPSIGVSKKCFLVNLPKFTTQSTGLLQTLVNLKSFFGTGHPPPSTNDLLRSALIWEAIMTFTPTEAIRPMR